MQEHFGALMVAIIGGLIIAGTGATLSGGGEKVSNWFWDLFRPDIPAEVIDTWAFEQWIGAPPESLSGATPVLKTLQIRDDDSYTVTGTISLGEGMDMANGHSGEAEMNDKTTIRFIPDVEGASPFIFEFEVDGNILRLTDIDGSTALFRRR